MHVEEKNKKTKKKYSKKLCCSIYFFVLFCFLLPFRCWRRYSRTEKAALALKNILKDRFTSAGLHVAAVLIFVVVISVFFFFFGSQLKCLPRYSKFFISL